MNFSIDELMDDPRFAAVRVCLEHGGLYEDRLDPETGHQQRCHDRGDAPKWEGYDVNEWIRLCDCCLAVLMRSGSRWSPFFCEKCRLEIIAAERGIPIGRHSMMNRVDPSNVTSMFDAIDRLHSWKSQRVRHLSEADVDPTVTEFLRVQPDPHAAVLDLLAWWEDTRPTLRDTLGPRVI